MIFVFGSNREGRHGKGAALEARKNHGAIYGQARGLQGNSYAIVTKELRSTHPRVTIQEIKQGVDEFLTFAREHPEMSFYVTKIGCGLAGYTPLDMGPLFSDTPHNVQLPAEFKSSIPGTEKNVGT